MTRLPDLTALPETARLAAARRWLRAALNAATAQRAERGEVQDGELGWITHERAVMLAEVNALRATLGRPPATEAEVRFVEGRAQGHGWRSVRPTPSGLGLHRRRLRCGAGPGAAGRQRRGAAFEGRVSD